MLSSASAESRFCVASLNTTSVALPRLVHSVCFFSRLFDEARAALISVAAEQILATPHDELVIVYNKFKSAISYELTNVRLCLVVALTGY